VNPFEGVPWFEGFNTWRRALSAELATLPETLSQLREGVGNFQRVTKRLVDASEAMEQFTRLYPTGLADAGRRLEEAARTMRDQVSSTGAGERVTLATEEVTKALSAMADLNPLWRRFRPPNPRQSDT
jgi:hypothetical protein